MERKWLVLSGAVGAAIYCLAVIVGGFFYPGYSHISQFVSELIADNAPPKGFLDPMFALYNLLTAAFALSLWGVVRAGKEPEKKAMGTAGALILLVEGVLGLATLFFPQDPVGAPFTATGTLHIVLAGLSSLSTMVAMVLVGIWLRADTQRKPYGTYSFMSVAFVFVCGGMAAAMGANQSPIAGLMERLTIGGFLQWMAVLSIVFYFAPRPSRATTYTYVNTR